MHIFWDIKIYLTDLLTKKRFQRCKFSTQKICWTSPAPKWILWVHSLGLVLTNLVIWLPARTLSEEWKFEIRSWILIYYHACSRYISFREGLLVGLFCMLIVNRKHGLDTCTHVCSFFVLLANSWTPFIQPILLMLTILGLLWLIVSLLWLKERESNFYSVLLGISFLD